MRKAEDIEQDICALSKEERAALARELIADSDEPTDPDWERAWLETSGRRCREVLDGSVESLDGPQVFEELYRLLAE